MLIFCQLERNRAAL